MVFAGTALAGELTRYPLPNNSTFPIAQAVEIPAGTTLVYHSGTTPQPVNPDAERYSVEFWGDTETLAAPGMLVEIEVVLARSAE